MTFNSTEIASVTRYVIYVCTSRSLDHIFFFHTTAINKKHLCFYFFLYIAYCKIQYYYKVYGSKVTCIYSMAFFFVFLFLKKIVLIFN